MRRAGFTLLEVLLVISLLGVLFLTTPGVEKKSLLRMANQDEVQRMVDLLRFAQRRAILTGKRQYFTLDPVLDSYRLYELEGSTENVQESITVKKLDLLAINRTVTGMENTFYYSPQGTPVFGCSITMQDGWCAWRVVIAVSTGKIRIEKG